MSNIVGLSGGANTLFDNSQSEQARNKLAEDLDNFLVLLTAQLQAQDPLSPMESTEFTTQLVGFAQVEQQIAQSEQLEQQTLLLQQNQIAQAVGYIGSTIEAVSNNVPLYNGEARFAYGLGEDAQQANVVIRDNSGQIVYTAPASTFAGVHEFIWDGKDSQGFDLPDGAYSVEISTLANVDDEDGQVSTYVTAFGQATAVTSDNGATVLIMGGSVAVPLDQILSISETEEETTASSGA